MHRSLIAPEAVRDRLCETTPGLTSRTIRLSPRLTSALRQAATDNGTDLAGLLEAAWAVLLSRTTGEDEVSFRTQCRPPNNKEVPDAVAVRIPIRADLPLADVVSALAQASITAADASAARTLVSWQCCGTPTVDYPLTLTGADIDDRLILEIRYLRPAFDDATARRLRRSLLALLKGLAKTPSESVGNLPLLTRSERRRILIEWNATGAAAPPRCVHHLFEEQAACQPDAVAVIFGQQRMTYGELNRRANRLAHHLRSLGVGPDSLVGLCLDRSPHVLVAILATLKAGGAYVPLDPQHPSEQLAFVLDDARVRVLITERRDTDRFVGQAAHILCIDDDTFAEAAEADPVPVSRPNHLIYVIYTSGSTGRPKGVAVEHRSVYQLVCWGESFYSREELSRVLFGVTICFDMSVFEIFLPLSLGGAVVMAENALQLRDLPAADDITMVISVPSLVTELLRTGGLPAALQTINVGGEALSDSLVRQLYAFPQVRKVYNLYGPTETTVTCTAHHVPPHVSAPPSIGRPITAARLYILDRQRQPVPVGTPGELYIGGAGVARGYLQRPELTADRFLPDPFVSDPDARMYRSGDLCRFQDNGEIDYLGRIDHQVKLRGFRIELGGIETVLGQHPAVASCAVFVCKDEFGSDLLTAYVLPRPGSTVAAPELREVLKTKLPGYMVPTHFILLQKWPLTPNGKIDRKALPPPTRCETRALVPPSTDAERALVPIWEAVLKIKPIGITDDFFELGGQSYLAALLTSKIRSELGHALPLSTLFAAPTIQKLSAQIQQNLEAGAPTALVPFQESGDRPPLFLIAGVGGHVFTFHRFGRLLGADQPTYGVKAIGVDGTRPPLTCIQEIAAAYLEEILACRPGGPYLLGGYSIGALVAFELALQMGRRGLPVPLLVVFDMHAPGHPKKLPLLRRLGRHLHHFVGQDRAGRAAYVRQRLSNVYTGLMHRVGLGARLAPEIPGAEALPRDALRRVWAGLMTARTRYRPTDRVDADILLFKAEQAPDWNTTVVDDPLMGWGEWTKGSIETCRVPRAHLDMFHDSNIEPVANRVREAIDRWMQR